MKKTLFVALLVILAATLLGCSSSNDDNLNIFMNAQGRVDLEGTVNGIKVVVAAQVVNGQSTQVSIDWGDGSVETHDQNMAIEHTYAAAGSRVLTFTSIGEDTEVEFTLSLIDVDADWYVASNTGGLRGTDCNDSNAAVNPEAVETAGDGEDSNCNGDEAT